MGESMYGKRILAVEDSADWREVILPRALKGAEVQGVSTVAEALEALNQGQIDAVIVDVFLQHSVGTGLEVVKAAERRDIPVLICTSAPEFAKWILGSRRREIRILGKSSVAAIEAAVGRLFREEPKLALV